MYSVLMAHFAQTQHCIERDTSAPLPKNRAGRGPMAAKRLQNECGCIATLYCKVFCYVKPILGFLKRLAFCRARRNLHPVAEKQSIHDRIGGLNAFRHIADNFYSRVTADRVLKPLFPKKTEHARERLALFLAETFGGANEYSRRRGMKSLQEMHARFQIDEEQIKAWKAHMLHAMQTVGIPKAALRSMRAYFCGHAGSIADSVEALWKLPPAEMRQRLKENPSLAARLLHRACGSTGQPDLDHVQFLLDAEVDPNAADSYGHTALYFAANSSGSDRIVRALLARKAAPNVHCGPTKSTPLHMAARRDNVEIGKLLIAAGADLEARDIKGHTPLRRALNCRQSGMTALLAASGANLDARDNNGVTPRKHARTKRVAL
jgi:hemoglobin